MNSNNNTEGVPLKSLEVNWDLIEQLPIKIRNFFNFESELPFTVKKDFLPFILENPSFYLRDIKNQHAMLMKRSTKEVYGPDHPQANETWGPLKPIRTPRRRRL